MSASRSPRVFISYSHDSPQHEERVRNLSSRLRMDGVDATIDQDVDSPPEGWPLWMETQIREADFVLVVCTAIYRRRIEHREEAHEGNGVVWEGNIIYNYLYSSMETKKFIPVIVEGASRNDVPIPLAGFTYYNPNKDYELLLDRLTRPSTSTPTNVGRGASLPVTEKSQSSLPSAFSLEQLSKSGANPRYASDIFRLDRIYDRRAIINKESVLVVVGTSVIAELLDRPVAALLRDHIDKRGGEYPYRRGVVINDRSWYEENSILGNNPVIAVGGPPTNKLADEFAKWAPPPPSREGKYPIQRPGSLTGFFRTNSAGRPQVGLWGNTASATREAVEHYLNDEQGLREFLRMIWK
jgi:hypothetical protein